MSDAYSIARGGRLKLKGEKTHRKRKHHEAGESSRKRNKSHDAQAEHDADATAHAGWAVVRRFSELHGSVAIQSASDSKYVRARDDGDFELGQPNDGEPAPDEVFTVIRSNETKIALKTGFGKYVSITKNGRLVGTSDAVGPRELFEPVFEEDEADDDDDDDESAERNHARRNKALRKAALCAPNGCFLSMDPDDSDRIGCRSQKAAASEFVLFRSNTIPKVGISESDRFTSEADTVKKYQSYQGGKLLLNGSDQRDLKAAQRSGKLHEALLDRREKMKSDKFCK